MLEYNHCRVWEWITGFRGPFVGFSHSDAGLQYKVSRSRPCLWGFSGSAGMVENYNFRITKHLEIIRMVFSTPCTSYAGDEVGSCALTLQCYAVCGRLKTVRRASATQKEPILRGVQCYSQPRWVTLLNNSGVWTIPHCEGVLNTTSVRRLFISRVIIEAAKPPGRYLSIDRISKAWNTAPFVARCWTSE